MFPLAFVQDNSVQSSSYGVNAALLWHTLYKHDLAMSDMRKRVSVQLPTYADNVALSAFVRLAPLLLSAGSATIDRYLLLAGPGPQQ